MSSHPFAFLCCLKRALAAARTSRHGHGFTLIEVLLVLAILAILAAIALPGYEQHVRRSHRAEARAALLQAATWMERVATAQGVYPLTLDFPDHLQTLSSGRYRIALDSDDGATWTLTAMRMPGSAQASDRCGNLTLAHTGARGLTDAAAGTAVLDCWNR